MALTALLLRTALILAGRGKSRGGSEIHTHTALVGRPASFSIALRSVNELASCLSFFSRPRQMASELIQIVQSLGIVLVVFVAIQVFQLVIVIVVVVIVVVEVILVRVVIRHLLQKATDPVHLSGR